VLGYEYDWSFLKWAYVNSDLFGTFPGEYGQIHMTLFISDARSKVFGDIYLVTGGHDENIWPNFSLIRYFHFI